MWTAGQAAGRAREEVAGVTAQRGRLHSGGQGPGRDQKRAWEQSEEPAEAPGSRRPAPSGFEVHGAGVGVLNWAQEGS